MVAKCCFTPNVGDQSPTLLAVQRLPLYFQNLKVSEKETIIYLCTYYTI
jgi:hypothetical protein